MEWQWSAAKCNEMKRFGHGFGTGTPQNPKDCHLHLRPIAEGGICILTEAGAPRRGTERTSQSEDETMGDMTRRFCYGAFDLTYL
jgi:hypothetical protein